MTRRELVELVAAVVVAALLVVIMLVYLAHGLDGA